MNFDLYSKIYDIIYSDKNYNDEVTYIHDILKKYQSKTILVGDVELVSILINFQN